MKSETRLTVEFGSGVDEYRIRGQQVEFRARCRGDSALPNWGSAWRPLTAEDISMHLALRTVVGKWLTVRLRQNALRRILNPPYNTARAKAA